MAAGVLAWLAAAAAATVVATTAVNAIGSGIVGAGARPLSQSEVAARLAASTPTAPTTPATAPPTTVSTQPTGTTTPPADAATGPSKSVVSPGGTVIARCVPGGVAVLSAIPAQGYQLDSRPDEVDDHPSVKFRAAETEVEVRLRCLDGSPQPEIRTKD